ncbi:hypothetical protein [Cobetia amphilecti]|uniref:Cytosolic protein n=1 Tax=Cobetia amphilecti TaxID=1055104 RepID=A0AAP4WZD4_9GAMM|nr:hypothetical protein [Cobetia amphilecti]MDO6670866.1 hypothetical protein [Cobetia amphilecti]
MTYNKVTSFLYGHYKVSWQIFDTSKPVFITFDNRGEAGDHSNRHGWGTTLFLSKNYNFISFMTSETCWFLDDDFDICLEYAKNIITASGLKDVIGYSGSMGAYAALLYREELFITRLILFNPITTLDPKIADWENRFSIDKALFMKKNRPTDSLSGFKHEAVPILIFYDPLCYEDSQHIKRLRSKFLNLKTIHLIGAGHGTPIYLSRIGLLKELAINLYGRELGAFYSKLKSTRYKQLYYNYMLASPRVKRSPWMTKVLLTNKVIYTHQNLHEKFSDLALIIKHEDINLANKLISRALELSPNNNALEKNFQLIQEAKNVQH